MKSVGLSYTVTPLADAMMQKRAKDKGTTVEKAIESFLKEERPTLATTTR